ncbi:MAG: 30S ribosomal protein S2 [Candidatus Aenigmarchaeota archaeon]|nr:30S ribosomal protein S2 [Candidatus Aenigmarchaeota archaeon]
MLIDKSEYLKAGVHIGMKTCTPFIKKFVYKIRDDGVAVFNLQKVDERIKIAANFLSNFNNIMVVARKENANIALNKFADVIDGKAITGRFSPGTLTNPSYKDFYEPDAIVAVDPLIDEQIIKEGKKKRIPIVALGDTFNAAKDIDLIIPANNNGKKSIGIIFWLLAREILKNKKKIKKDSDFKFSQEDFGVEEDVVEEKK